MTAGIIFQIFFDGFVNCLKIAVDIGFLDGLGHDPKQAKMERD